MWLGSVDDTLAPDVTLESYVCIVRMIYVQYPDKAELEALES